MSMPAAEDRRIPEPPADPDDPNWWYRAPGCRSLLERRDPLGDDDDSEGLCTDYRCRCADPDCECHETCEHTGGPYSEDGGTGVSVDGGDELPRFLHPAPTGWEIPPR